MLFTAQMQHAGLGSCFTRYRDNSNAINNFPKASLNRSFLHRNYGSKNKCPGTKDTKGKLMTRIGFKKPKITDKITVVGAGSVGMASVSAILQLRLTQNLCIMDMRRDFVKAEALDFLHGSVFNDCPNLTSCCDGSKTKDSKYVIITCGKRPKLGFSRLTVAQPTADILAATVPCVVKGSPDATYIVVSNPADVMTFVLQKLFDLPKERCFSAGTNLDTSRFRYFIAKRLGVSPNAVYGFTVGEHGENLVPLWSTVTVGGTPLVELNPDIGTDNDSEKWCEVVKETIMASQNLVKAKGYTSWAIGLSVANIIAKMKENSGCILPIGTICKGVNGVRSPVVMSMPCMVTPDGISHIMNLRLTEWEKEQIQKAEKVLYEQQRNIKVTINFESNCR